MTINEIQPVITINRDHERSPIKAFVELQFISEDEVPLFIVRGVTVKVMRDHLGFKKLSVDFPAYKSGGKYYKSFIVHEVDYYRRIQDLVMDQYLIEANSEGIDTSEWEIEERTL